MATVDGAWVVVKFHSLVGTNQLLFDDFLLNVKDICISNGSRARAIFKADCSPAWQPVYLNSGGCTFIQPDERDPSGQTQSGSEQQLEKEKKCIIIPKSLLLLLNLPEPIISNIDCDLMIS